MAKQLGIINFRGSIGDITYVKTEDGYQVRRKSSLDKARVLTDKNFEGSRRASEEFGTAAKAGKLLRTSVLLTIKNAVDSKLHSRMLKTMFDILKTDSVSAWGKRLPAKGKLQLLTGFEFNRNKRFTNIFTGEYHPVTDRVAGIATVDFPAFSPANNLITPEGAAYFKFVYAVTEPDFASNNAKTTFTESEMMAADADQVPAFTMSQNFTPQTALPVITILGIRFYSYVNGKYNQLFADAFNAVRIIAVDTAYEQT